MGSILRTLAQVTDFSGRRVTFSGLPRRNAYYNAHEDQPVMRVILLFGGEICGIYHHRAFDYIYALAGQMPVPICRCERYAVPLPCAGMPHHISVTTLPFCVRPRG